MTRGSAGCCVLWLLGAAACTEGNEQRDGGTPSTVADAGKGTDFCRGFARGQCAILCDPTEACERALANQCDLWLQEQQRLVEQGRAAPIEGYQEACLSAVTEYAAVVEGSFCDLVDGEATVEVQGLFFGTRTCNAGRDDWDGGLYQDRNGPYWRYLLACSRLSAGLVPPGAPCTSAYECSEGYCSAEPGGCGVCVSPEPTSDACLSRNDAGEVTSRRPCELGWGCDESTARCVRNRALGEACGPALGRCFLGCGARCSADGGVGTCEPFGGANAPCNPGRQNECAPGLGCVYSLMGDGGARCQPQVGEGAPCGPGTNFDELAQESPYSADEYAGGASLDAPLCQPGMLCEALDGGFPGRCRRVGARAAGETCGETARLEDTCPPGFSCRSNGSPPYRCLPVSADGESCDRPRDCRPESSCGYQMGRSVCVPRVGAGEACGGAGECLQGLTCTYGAPVVVCVAPASPGQPCTYVEDCAGPYATCDRGVCVLQEDAVLQPEPMCQ